MNCDTAREALSARIDGEREAIPAGRVDEHLAGCDSCTQWQAAAVEQTQLLRRLAGRSQLAAVQEPTKPRPAQSRPVRWQRWALAAAGIIQLVLAVAQGVGATLGLPHAETGEHVLNESTAWSAALGVVMLAAAVRPALAGGLAGVLATFIGFLALYELADADAGRVSVERGLTHLPVLAGALLALSVWRRDRPVDPGPDRTALVLSDEIVLPDNASRGRRRGHLHSTDGSAA